MSVRILLQLTPVPLGLLHWGNHTVTWQNKSVMPWCGAPVLLCALLLLGQMFSCSSPSYELKAAWG